MRRWPQWKNFTNQISIILICHQSHPNSSSQAQGQIDVTCLCSFIRTKSDFLFIIKIVPRYFFLLLKRLNVEEVCTLEGRWLLAGTPVACGKNSHRLRSIFFKCSPWIPREPWSQPTTRRSESCKWVSPAAWGLVPLFGSESPSDRLLCIVPKASQCIVHIHSRLDLSYCDENKQ